MPQSSLNNNSRKVIFLVVTLIGSLLLSSVPASVTSANGDIAFSSDRDSNGYLDINAKRPYDFNPYNWDNLTRRWWDPSSHYRDKSPTYGPRGKKIAIVSNKPTLINSGKFHLSIMDHDGGNVHNVTIQNTRNNSGPDWSPNGTRLAYGEKCYSNNVWTPCIYTINVNGTQKVGPIATTAAAPTYAPDNWKIAYVHKDPSSDINIWTMDINGGNQTNLSGYTNGPNAMISSPDYSSNGNKIVFAKKGHGLEEVEFITPSALLKKIKLSSV